MNFFNVFEDRIASVFGTSPQGYTEPFSFKKLAKRAAKEMEKETYVINGVDTAPGLYTILVSSADDAVMRPLYGALTNEIAQFVEGQAQSKGYTFVGEPLVRFMVDPSLRSGKFSVFAENVDARTLGRLRAEEISFLEKRRILQSALCCCSSPPSTIPTPRSSARARVPQVAVPPQEPVPTPPAVPQEFAPEADGLDVLPANEVNNPMLLSEHATPQPVPNPVAAPVPQTVRRPSQQQSPHKPLRVRLPLQLPACLSIAKRVRPTMSPAHVQLLAVSAIAVAWYCATRMSHVATQSFPTMVARGELPI